MEEEEAEEEEEEAVIRILSFVHPSAVWHLNRNLNLDRDRNCSTIHYLLGTGTTTVRVDKPSLASRGLLMKRATLETKILAAVVAVIVIVVAAVVVIALVVVAVVGVVAVVAVVVSTPT